MNGYQLGVVLAALLLASCAEEDPGAEFLNDNGQREEVTTTESGLQYEILEEGDGAKPTLQDQVIVHYRGELVDGVVFDSSYSRGQPASFPLSGVVPGWKEGLQLMTVGSTYKFYLPPELGYGERDMGVIPPNSVLIFRVELLGIRGR